MGDVDAGSSGSIIPTASVGVYPDDELLQRGVMDPPARPGLAGAMGRYAVHRVLGAGGMAVVLLGVDPSDGKRVAIKVLRPELLGHNGAVRRFLNEARHMQRLGHERIVPVTEVCERASGPWFAMPYMSGGSLAERIAAGGLAEDAVIAIARDVAEALAFAHARGIIHRDLKPANVLLDERGRAHLADFGLGRTVYNDSIIDVRQQQTEGTPSHMAPEVAAGLAGDTRCDIYSFGAMLYEMLCGAPPYQGESPEQVLMKVRAGPPVPLRQRCPGAPAGLAQVVEWAMARDVRDRYTQMGDVRADLERIAAGQRPAGPRGRPSLPRGRIAAAAGLAVAGLGLSLLAWQNVNGAPELRLVQETAFAAGVQAGNMFLGDYDGNGAPDLCFRNGEEFCTTTLAGQIIARAQVQTLGAAAADVIGSMDVDGRRGDEIAVNWCNGTDIGLSILNSSLNTVHRYRAQGTEYEYKDGVKRYSGLGGGPIADLDGDGRKELIAHISTGFGSAPRGVRCFDLASGELRWGTEIGPCPEDTEAVDLDGDGRLEVLMSSTAVDNGNIAPDGSDDRHSYVHAWGYDGRPLWRRQLGEAYTFTRLCIVKSAAGNDLYTWLSSPGQLRRSRGQEEVGGVFHLGPDGAVVDAYEVRTELISCMAVDVTGDGAAEIVATDRQGRVHVLTRKLEALRVVQLVAPRHDDVHLRLWGSADLDGDGKRELVFTSSDRKYETIAAGMPEEDAVSIAGYDNAVVLTDLALAPAGKYVYSARQRFAAARLHLADADGDGRPEVVLLDSRAMVLKYGRKRP